MTFIFILIAFIFFTFAGFMIAKYIYNKKEKLPSGKNLSDFTFEFRLPDDYQMNVWMNTWTTTTTSDPNKDYDTYVHDSAKELDTKNIYDKFTFPTLEERLEQAIKDEDYELAAACRDLIKQQPKQV